MKNCKRNLVVVGNGLAGARAVEQILQRIGGHSQGSSESIGSDQVLAQLKVFKERLAVDPKAQQVETRGWRMQVGTLSRRRSLYGVSRRCGRLKSPLLPVGEGGRSGNA